MNIMRALVLMAVLATPVVAQTPASNGVTYLDTQWGGRHYKVARIDLTRTDLRMYWKNAQGRPIGSLDSLRQYLSARGETLLAGMNAGMYDSTRDPTGLFIARGYVGRQLNTQPDAIPPEVHGNFYELPNGVFYIAQDGTAHIVTTSRAAAVMSTMVEATQSGPHLLDAGTIHPFAGTGGPRRNAIAVCSPTEVALVIAPDSGAGPTFHELSRFIRDRLHCQDALYLDGANKSALWVEGQSPANTRRFLVGLIGVTRRTTPAAPSPIPRP